MVLLSLTKLTSLKIHWCVWDNIPLQHNVYFTLNLCHFSPVFRLMPSLNAIAVASSEKAIIGVFVFIFTRCLLLYNVRCVLSLLSFCVLFVHWRMNQSVVICSFVRVFDIQHRQMSHDFQSFFIYIYLKCLNNDGLGWR